MKRFREISATKARKIDRAIAGMADAAKLEELEQRFLSESTAILPADCTCWNNWSAD